MKKIICGLLALAALSAPAAAAQYKIDADHSSVSFTVAHMAISKVHGRFDKFSGTVEYDPKNPKGLKVEASIDAASINTSVDARDKHLKSPDFFDAEKFPALTFKSTRVLSVKGMSGKLEGELTIHGVTKTVVLAVEGSGPAKDPWGNERMAATATTSINRKDFGLVWNKVMETGGLLVGEKVDIVLEIEAVKEAPAPAAPAK